MRILLSAMVPSFAIGLTGLFVTSIGRLLLALPRGGEIPMSVPVAMALVIAIMGGCALASAIPSRAGTRRPPTSASH